MSPHDRVVYVVYVACADTREIHRFRLDATGALDLLDITNVPGLDGPSPISMPFTLSADRRFLYAALREPPFTLASFAIDATDGTLTLIGSTTVEGSMAYLSAAPADASGRVRHLLCASGFEGLVVSVAIEDNGVARETVHVATVTPRGHCVMPRPTLPGRGGATAFVYATSIGADEILRFRYEPATGALTDPLATPAPPGSNPRHLLFSHDASLLYVIGEADASVTVYDVDGTDGTLRRRQFVGTQEPGFDALGADLHLTPDGRFLFTSERNANVITTLRVAAVDGTLEVTGSVPTEDWTRSFALDPDGAFLVAAGQRSHHLSVFSIDRNSGALELRHRYPTAGNPSWIEISRPGTSKGTP